jgi:hypothetical protein
MARSVARVYREGMQVEISPDAAEFARQHGGAVWVWSARPRMCCASAPPYMHAAAQPPQQGTAGFQRLPSAGVDVWFRAPAGRRPGSLEIALRGRRHPRLEAYWDGCLFALDA